MYCCFYHLSKDEFHDIQIVQAGKSAVIENYMTIKSAHEKVSEVKLVINTTKQVSTLSKCHCKLEHSMVFQSRMEIILISMKVACFEFVF